MFDRSRLIVAALFWCVLLSGAGILPGVGCSRTYRAGDRQYQTVESAPNRDTDTARTLNARALAHLEESEVEQAEKLLKDALAADITFGPAHNNLGKVYFQQGKLYLAAWEFQYAARLMPHQPEPRNNLGLVYERVGKLADAVDWYAKARELEPDNPELLGNLARAKVRRGDRDEQLRELLTELALKETRPEWRDWAERKLALFPRTDEPTTSEAP